MTDSVPALGPVIVVGGCGFIGSHIVDGLLKREPECEIHVIDIDTSRNRVEYANVTYHTRDVSSVSDVEAVFALAKPKTILHTASPDPSTHETAVFRRVNVGGANNLIVAARTTGTVQAMIFTGTPSVIHDSRTGLVDADETWPVLGYPAQRCVYSLTMAEAEAKILAANREAGDASMLTASLRPGTTFGPRDSSHMGKILADARAGKTKRQIGCGDSLHDFIYVTDVVEAHILTAEALIRSYGKPAPSPSTRIDGEVFHISNERMGHWEFQRAVASSLGVPAQKTRKRRPVPVGAAMALASVNELCTWICTMGTGHSSGGRDAIRLATLERTLNCEKAKKRLGFAPQVGVEKGLREARAWFAKEANKAEC